VGPGGADCKGLRRFARPNLTARSEWARPLAGRSGHTEWRRLIEEPMKPAVRSRAEESEHKVEVHSVTSLRVVKLPGRARSGVRARPGPRLRRRHRAPGLPGRFLS